MACRVRLVAVASPLKQASPKERRLLGSNWAKAKTSRSRFLFRKNKKPLHDISRYLEILISVTRLQHAINQLDQLRAHDLKTAVKPPKLATWRMSMHNYRIILQLVSYLESNMALPYQTITLPKEVSKSNFRHHPTILTVAVDAQREMSQHRCETRGDFGGINCTKRSFSIVIVLQQDRKVSSNKCGGTEDWWGQKMYHAAASNIVKTDRSRSTFWSWDPLNLHHSVCGEETDSEVKIFEFAPLCGETARSQDIFGGSKRVSCRRRRDFGSQSFLWCTSPSNRKLPFDSNTSFNGALHTCSLQNA